MKWQFDKEVWEAMERVGLLTWELQSDASKVINKLVEIQLSACNQQEARQA